MIKIQNALHTLLDNQDLSHDEMVDIMRIIMQGKATPAQIAGFLIALRAKGETVDEITAAAEVMRELATKVEINGPHRLNRVRTPISRRGLTACFMAL